MVRRRRSRNSLPLTLVTWHRSTYKPGYRFELLDANLAGYDDRFRVQSYYLDYVVSDESYNSEVSARQEFERKVESHYDIH